jgi:hypothetical protein
METSRATVRATFAVAVLLSLGGIARAYEAGEPGQRPLQSPPSSSVAAARQAAVGGLSNQFFSASGKIYTSVDAAGSNLGPTNLRVNKKNSTSSVRKAFLLAASTGFSGSSIPNGALTLAGVGINWDQQVPSLISSQNCLADVTSIVKPIVDAAAAGTINVSVSEGSNTFAIDGEVLAVVFDDSSQAATHSIVLLFGAQDPAGDSFAVTLAEPIDPNAPGALADFGLGISFGFQGTIQYSTVSVNSQPLTAAAGGQDDCRDASPANGCLITVGGIGDSNTNPPNPNAAPSDARSDDELYTLLPFITSSTTSVSVSTNNPSSDDNIFFAYFEVSAAAVVGQGIVLAPDSATNPVDTTHTVTATVVNTLGQPIVGRTVSFTVISGPNVGASGSDVTNAAGQASYTYSGSGGPGTDQIQASFVDDTGATITSNIVTKTWVLNECSNDAECDDGDPCNGTETCVAGGCVAGSPPPVCQPTPTTTVTVTATVTPSATPTPGTLGLKRTYLSLGRDNANRNGKLLMRVIVDDPFDLLAGNLAADAVTISISDADSSWFVTRTLTGCVQRRASRVVCWPNRDLRAVFTRVRKSTSQWSVRLYIRNLPDSETGLTTPLSNPVDPPVIVDFENGANLSVGQTSACAAKGHFAMVCKGQ